VSGEVFACHHVNVGLIELAEATLLRPFAPPHLLDLVAPKREREVALALLDIARERHREVKVKAKLGDLSPATCQYVDLLGGLRLSAEALKRLDRAGLDLTEAVEFEHLTQAIDHVELHETLGGGPFGEA